MHVRPNRGEPPVAMNRPKAFEGTDEEREANFATHDFLDIHGDTRCLRCDCRDTGTYATWPCGFDVPREDVGSEATPNTWIEALAWPRTDNSTT